VHICTPNKTHYSLCRAFIEAGKHVLVEKPLTEDYGEALELVELSRKKNVNLSVGHIFRFNNAINMIKKMYDEGVLGELKYVRLQWTSFLYPPPGRDVIFDLAPHPIDIINYVFDKWPRRVYCKAKSYIREEKEEVAYIIAEFEKHRTAHIEVSWLYPKKIREVCIMTDRGFYVIDALAQTVNHYDGSNWHPIDVIPNNTIKSEIEHFIETIENGRKSINHGENGAENVRVLEIIHQSNREGKEMDVEF
jgi:predicted dehydrogenase